VVLRTETDSYVQGENCAYEVMLYDGAGKIVNVKLPAAFECWSEDAL